MSAKPQPCFVYAPEQESPPAPAAAPPAPAAPPPPPKPPRRPRVVKPGNPDDLLTPAHCARILECHISTIYRLCLHHKIPARRRGGKYLIRRQDFENYARGEEIPKPLVVDWPPRAVPPQRPA